MIFSTCGVAGPGPRAVVACEDRLGALDWAIPSSKVPRVVNDPGSFSCLCVRQIAHVWGRDSKPWHAGAIILCRSEMLQGAEPQRAVTAVSCHRSHEPMPHAV